MEGYVALFIGLLGLGDGQDIAIGGPNGYEHGLGIGTLIDRLLRGTLHVVVQTYLDRRRRIRVVLFHIRERRTIFIDHRNGPAGLAIDFILDRGTHARHQIGCQATVAGDQSRFFIEAHAVHAFHLGAHGLGLILRKHGDGKGAVCLLQFLGQILGIHLRNGVILAMGGSKCAADLGSGGPHIIQRAGIYHQPVIQPRAHQFHPVGRNHAGALCFQCAQFQVLICSQVGVDKARLPPHRPLILSLSQRHLRVIAQGAVLGQVPGDLVVRRGEVLILVHAFKLHVEPLGLQAGVGGIESGGGVRGGVGKRG